MKLTRNRQEEGVRAQKAPERSEQRFRFPATEEISEISCRGDSQRCNEGDEPGDARASDVAVAS
jgi:hypothetical protein